MKNAKESIKIYKPEYVPEISVIHAVNILNSFPMHFHTSLTLGLVSGGERIFQYRGRSESIKADDVFVIQPFEPHSCSSLRGSSHNYKIISIDFDHSHCFYPFLINRCDILDNLLTFHQEIENDCNSITVLNLFNELIRKIKLFSTEEDLQRKDVRKDIITAKKFIENKCLENISVKEIAESANLSEFHFNRMFHKSFGLSAYAYLLYCRTKKSQQLLLEHRSVTVAAVESGFFDQSHFTRLFKKHVGVSPGRFLCANKP